MPNYIRANAPGATYFFTVNLQNRHSSLLTDNIELLREAFRKTRRNYPFYMDAITILQDHLHAVWTLPEDDADFALRWRLIKGHFSRGLPLSEARSKSRHQRGERQIWQRRYWEHQIRDEKDYRRHIDYCYINPLKHGHVPQVSEWAYSSFHRDVKWGIYPRDWAGEVDAVGSFAER